MIAAIQTPIRNATLTVLSLSLGLLLTGCGVSVNGTGGPQGGKLQIQADGAGNGGFVPAAGLAARDTGPGAPVNSTGSAGTGPLQQAATSGLAPALGASSSSAVNAPDPAAGTNRSGDTGNQADAPFNPLAALMGARGATQGDGTSTTLQGSGSSNSSGPAQATAGQRKYRVWATAEGLIGGTTASGVKIGKWMEGAALPSRKALKRNVAVVYLANGRGSSCPVLDVGPWNTKDAYWETAEGRPAAEKGRDQFGRRTNKAGIDLFNATWYKLLGLRSYDKRLIENTSGMVEWNFQS